MKRICKRKNKDHTLIAEISEQNILITGGAKENVLKAWKI